MFLPPSTGAPDPVAADDDVAAETLAPVVVADFSWNVDDDVLRDLILRAG